ncbi:class I SAM-dependent methyltransferase [Actinoalloteichus fjordicus]|uniref:SAM-dependent methyltransferase n=1 Tax=Actinoalloteichus fjordicus TaxID=1612552 RepID=A0AAC9LCI7_9PSEU|nr:SAM-dependent methyltransferase [Actinoalloteichus fjordicus]APU20161.1 SAM-dependent methyltransferase [Actinoalloteichus sp. GBA129-24]
MTIDSPQDTAAQQSDRYAAAQAALGATRYGHAEVDGAAARLAGRAWWDADADEYQASHGDFLGDAEFRWCPEGLLESEVGLLGEVAGRSVLEVGCGSASCSRWLAGRGAAPVALDISSGMLRHAEIGARRTGRHVPLVQASADALPFADDSFDAACSAFGAIPFVADLDQVMREVARVLRPGARWVFAVTHPMRWIFPDDPGPDGLTVRQSYFDRAPYVEADDEGTPTYVEFHRTLGDFVRAIEQAGLRLTDLIEPEWPAGHEREWGQWSPLRGRLFPGTAIFCCRTR